MNLPLIAERISVSPNSYTVPAESVKYRDGLALKAQEITAIQSAETNIHVAEIVREIRQHVKDVKAVRMQLSKPLDTAKFRLIEIEANHCLPLLDEQERLEKLGSQWMQREKIRVAEEERKRNEEIRKLEAARLEAELRVETERLKGATDALQDEIEAANMAEIKANKAIMAPLPEVNRVKGQVTKRYLRHKVIDARAVYAVRPDLCTVEVRPSAINAVLIASEGATEWEPDTTTCAGLALWWEDRTNYTTR